MADYLQEIFTNGPCTNPTNHYPDNNNSKRHPIKKEELYAKIHNLNNRKTPGYELITALIIKELPPIGLRYITILTNAILRIVYFPQLWKCAEVILLLKPGKNRNSSQSYMPISILPILSKVVKKIIQRKVITIAQNKNLIPDHQFVLRKKHNTIEQTHRMVQQILQSLVEEILFSSLS